MSIAQASTSSKPIPLHAPEFAGNEWNYLKECLDSGWVSSAGPFVDRFEQDVARYVGAKEGVAVMNGTVGLQIALQAIGVRPGDEVLVSGLTFVAPVNAIRYCQAQPVFIDADPTIWQMDTKKLEAFLDVECKVQDGFCFHQRTHRRIQAILPVHILGLACEMDRIVALARRYRLKVVEDAAEAIGVCYQDRHVGTFGDVGVISFNGNKVITCGGGGMLVTNDPLLARRARYLTTQAKDDELEYLHKEIGYNYRLTNLQAAVGCAQLEQLDHFLFKKRQIASRYEEGLQGLQGFVLMPNPSHTQRTCWLYTVLLPEGTTLAQRQAFVKRLHADGVAARPLWHPIHELPPYRDCSRTPMEHARRLYERAVSLPSSVGLEESQQERCMEAVKKHAQELG